MNTNQIRTAFLDYFVTNGHTQVKSSSLIPHNDPTLFFVNAGMVQFKDTFTGQEQRPYRRATSSQKCLRVSGKHNDLENVGRTPRHHTMFEMLGNFSFGDYFKEDAIRHAWHFLTEVCKIDPDRLWVTVFEEDEEAERIWIEQIGVPKARVQRMDAKENFWSMGDTGPCGPCSEIHYDHGANVSSEEGGPATGDDRYVEIWNLVFMQYEQHADGSRTDLPRPSIDTGMGLERIAAVMQGVYSNYDTDLFRGIIARAAELASKPYGDDPEVDTALRVIADHSRATAFLIGDGVMPSNEGRGYVLRRIMRRAIRFGVKLGIDQLFLHHTVAQVIDDMAVSYPELNTRRGFINEVVRGEEERFRRTLHRGMRLLDNEIAKATTHPPIPGDAVFKLEDTFGFPLDLTRLIAAERGIALDEAGYYLAREAQRQRGRASWKGSGEQAVGQLWPALARNLGATSFTGHTHEADTGTVLALLHVAAEGLQQVHAIAPGEQAILLLDRTPFYAEAGGQVGDTGTIGPFEVHDTTRSAGLHLHHGQATQAIRIGDTLQAQVHSSRRANTRRNHTGTHLLHAALRAVLGEHVTQKGSLVGPQRLRFDFAHHKPMTPDELHAVEDAVNRDILGNTPVATTLERLDHAIELGAMALFGEKYPDPVRVVNVPGCSVELCGGTHVSATGDIGLLRITNESGVAAGVRRIEAQTGPGALATVRHDALTLQAAALQLKAQPNTLVDAIRRLQAEKKEVDHTLASLQRVLAKQAATSLIDQAREFGGVKVLAATFNGNLKEQADRLRDQLGSSLVVLAAQRNGRVQLIVAASKDLAGRVHAGKIIKEIAPLVGGGGGGRPDMAQAGGKNPAGIPAALARAYVVVEQALSA